MSTVDINGGFSIGEVEDSSDISIMQSASISGQTPANPGRQASMVLKCGVGVIMKSGNEYADPWRGYFIF